MNAAPPSRWAIPDAIADPAWTTRSEPRQHRSLLLTVGLPAATMLVLATAGAAILVDRATNHPAQSTPAAPGISPPALTVTSTAQPSSTAHPSSARPSTPVVSRPARKAPSAPRRSAPAVVLPPAAGQQGAPNPTVTVTSVVVPVTPTRPVARSSTPARTTAPTTRPAPAPAPTPVQVTSTARQSITCPAGSQLDVTGSSDRPGTLSLTGGGNSRTASGTHPAITVQVTHDATFTAAMTGINPHVAVSCA